MDKAEQEAAEILIEKGFADPEELEPEIAALLRLAKEDRQGVAAALYQICWELFLEKP